MSYDYAREIHDCRDQADRDYWNTKDHIPTRADLEGGTDDVIKEKSSVTPNNVKRKRKRIPIKPR